MHLLIVKLYLHDCHTIHLNISLPEFTWCTGLASDFFVWFWIYKYLFQMNSQSQSHHNECFFSSPLPPSCRPWNQDFHSKTQRQLWKLLYLGWTSPDILFYGKWLCYDGKGVKKHCEMTVEKHKHIYNLFIYVQYDRSDLITYPQYKVNLIMPWGISLKLVSCHIPPSCHILFCNLWGPMCQWFMQRILSKRLLWFVGILSKTCKKPGVPSGNGIQQQQQISLILTYWIVIHIYI